MGKKKSKIIIVGLDNSGKSTMINKLKPKKVCIKTQFTLYLIKISCLHFMFKLGLYCVHYLKLNQ